MKQIIRISYLLWILPFAVAATVYKCELNGVMTYRQLPCSNEVELTQYATDKAINPTNPLQQPKQTESPSEALAKGQK